MNNHLKQTLFLFLFVFSAVNAEEYIFSTTTISTEDNTLTLSLYSPKGYGPFPAVVILPGGHGPKEIGKAWSHYHDYAKKLTGYGISAMVVNYSNANRLFLDLKNIDDIKSSIEFIKNQDGIQKQNIFLAGFSMGGANALRVAGSGVDIAGLICFFAPCDFRVSSKKLPFTISKQPIEYCDSINCPVLILQGAKDLITSVDQAYLLQKRLKSSGKKSKLIIYIDAEHGFTFKGISAGNGLAYDPKITRQSLLDVEKFLLANLRATGE